MPEAVSPPAAIVSVMLVVAEVPAPVPVTTRVYTPVGVVGAAASVNVVLQVTVQLEEENPAVTPAGREEIANETPTGLPVSRFAVMPSCPDWPCTIVPAGKEGASENVDGVAAVVKV
jgi:hypothetical protein